MITRKAGPALAAGCTVVLKPASQTPFSALALAELAERAGIPKGVFNVVTGSAPRDRRRADREPDRAQALVHRLDRGRQAADGAVRDARSRSCRSSSAATRRSSSSTTPTSTRRSRARSRRSTATPARPASARTGCSCRTRVYDAFAEKLADAVQKLKSAPGTEPSATQGPLIDDKAVEKVESTSPTRPSKGARVLRRRQAPRARRPVLRADDARPA